MNEALANYINRYVSFTEDELEIFQQRLVEGKFEKGSTLLEAGNTCKQLFFIVEGLVRSYYIDSKGNEKVTSFGKEHWWVTDMESFIHQTPSQLFIAALEHTTVLTITKDRLEDLYLEVPKVERLFRLITERWLIALQRSSFYYMKATSKDRYYNMVKLIPNFVNRVPQYMIASYLDITPEYLSELRRSH